MTTSVPIVFLVDVDNTLLDNDRIQNDLKRHLEREFGAACRDRYWAILEELFADLGYRDYLGALQRYRVEHPQDIHLLTLSSFLVDYPFANRLYPESLDVLERFRPETDLFVFSNVSMDTLDYTSGKVNEGSKAIMLGLGEPVRKLPRQFKGELPHIISRAEVFCGGCLVLQGASFAEDEMLASKVASDAAFANWPLIVLHDDARVARSSPDFLWATWTRFEPAADIYASNTSVQRHHLVYKAPIVIDARTKPGFPDELIVRDDIKALVDQRWAEYFNRG